MIENNNNRNEELLLAKIGSKEYLNENCWLARNLRIPPAKRCWYCVLTFRNCPIVQYLIPTIIFLFGSLAVLFLIEGEVSKPVLVIILIIVFGYGWFANYSTEKLIKANFQERKLRIELGGEKKSLEIKVAVRTKELKELAVALDQRVKERTKDLQEKMKELERFNRLAVGRELKMVGLKEEIKKLKEESENTKKSDK